MHLPSNKSSIHNVGTSSAFWTQCKSLSTHPSLKQPARMNVTVALPVLPLSWSPFSLQSIPHDVSFLITRIFWSENHRTKTASLDTVPSYNPGCRYCGHCQVKASMCRVKDFAGIVVATPDASQRMLTLPANVDFSVSIHGARRKRPCPPTPLCSPPNNGIA